MRSRRRDGWEAQRATRGPALLSLLFLDCSGLILARIFLTELRRGAPVIWHKPPYKEPEHRDDCHDGYRKEYVRVDIFKHFILLCWG